LNGLDEQVFLRIFATTQAHALVAGTGTTLSDITNADGVRLYPAFYHTLVRVPPPLRFDQHKSWSAVDIGVHLQRFGRMLLQSFGAVAPVGTLPRDVAQCDRSQLIHVEANLIFVHDTSVSDELRVDAPQQGTIAELEALKQRPRVLEEQRRIRAEGAIHPAFSGRLNLRVPIRYPILLGRDVQVGRAMLFAAFTTLFEVGEQTLLTEQLWPPMNPELLTHRHLLEREIYYFGNLRLGEIALLDTCARITPCPPELKTAYEGSTGVALLEVRAEVYDEGSKRLLAAAHTRKLLAVPTQAVQDAQRLLAQHGER
jgi:probable biosynthetic protein (TIGR04098 family)